MLPVATNLFLQAQVLAAICYSGDVLSYAESQLPHPFLDDIRQVKQVQGISNVGLLSVESVQQLVVEAKRLIQKVRRSSGLAESTLSLERVHGILGV